jgi:diguanylate cyclase (GGDEF)-like protein
LDKTTRKGKIAKVPEGTKEKDDRYIETLRFIKRSLVLFLIPIVLVARVLYLSDIPKAQWLWDIRLALSAIFAIPAILSLFHVGEKKVNLLALVLPKRDIFREAILVAWLFTITLADIAAGQYPYIFVIGIVAIGALFWEKRRFFLLFAVPSAIALSIVGIQIHKVVEYHILALMAASLALGFAMATIIRNWVTLGVEKMHTLEEANKELWDLSFRDGLTGLYNRRFAQEQGASLFTRAARYREYLHVLMIDIDHFKRVNDKLSHPVGDDVLKEISKIIQTCVRSSDFVARYGGEEFIVFLPLAEPELVQSIANRIRNTVNLTKFPKVPWHVTISVGVSGLLEGDSLESLVGRADQFLYISKRTGRNRVSGY